jgi:hypothetical protein
MRASYDKAEHLHHRLPGTAYAVARVTAGTNLLAMYTCWEIDSPDGRALCWRFPWVRSFPQSWL